MANTLSAKKRVRQSKKRELRNSSHRSAMRTTIKKTLKSLPAKDKAATQAAFIEATAAIDRVAGKGIIPANRAARLKSRLAKRINALEKTQSSSRVA